jgi:hypothetical protein
MNTAEPFAVVTITKYYATKSVLVEKNPGYTIVDSMNWRTSN